MIMINRLIAEGSKKVIALLGMLVGAMVTALLAKIREYFLKPKWVNEGKEAALAYWNEQQKIWEEKVNRIKEDSQKTVREKMKELQKVKRAFEEYVKRNKSSDN